MSPLPKVSQCVGNNGQWEPLVATVFVERLKYRHFYLQIYVLPLLSGFSRVDDDGVLSNLSL